MDLLICDLIGAARPNSFGVRTGNTTVWFFRKTARIRNATTSCFSDIFPTGWHATRLAYLVPGDSVVIYGSGPVGLITTLSAIVQGASQSVAA